MLNEGTLKAGQVIRSGNQLYRVDYVNECRARIVPLAKRHVTLEDGREFDAERAGVNIAARSMVEIVDDIELARAKIEVEEAEREIRVAELGVARQEVKAPVAQRSTSVIRTSGGWYVVKPATFKDGSLADIVMAFILVHPGLTTKQIVEGCPAQGAVAACVSRFHQAGLIKKS